jgi:hypothetical protein
MKYIRKEVEIITGTSHRTSWRETARGKRTAAIPRLIKTLAILLPTIFPMAMSGWPRKAELTVTASSGALVLKAITVNPATRGEIPA